MQATLSSADEVPPGRFLFERKYDGYRALAALSGRQVRLVTRNGLELGSRVPSIPRALARLGLKDTVLDGEVVAEDASGQQRFSAMGAPGARHLFFVFDVLRDRGEDLRGLPVESRRAVLERLLARARPPVQLAERAGGEAGQALAEARRRGWEGLIAKRRGSAYEGRRSRAWLKLKLRQGQEVVVGGYLPMEGKPRALGALLVGVPGPGGGLRYAGRVGTGFSDAVREGLRAVLDARPRAASPFHPPPRLRGARWTEPRWVAQVAFTEWTADGKLRHPSFLGLREDKAPGDVVREEPRGT
jgi:bifunctional non-homologous end joining protein LigD